ncbi:MAG: hypothetical protein ACP5HS_14460 [Anaerolineae bacterium]
MSGQDRKTWNFDGYSWARHYDKIVASDSEQYFAQYDKVLTAVVERANLVLGREFLTSEREQAILPCAVLRWVLRLLAWIPPG